MPEFLRLPTGEQRDILTAMSAALGRSSQVLHKDIWVCWALRELFSLDTGVRMAFKGGTSLSKVFQVIHRFSEDVDITLDYRDLCTGAKIDPLAEGTSTSAMKRFGKDLQARVQELIKEVIHPAMAASFTEVTAGAGRVELSDCGEKLWLHYPSASDSSEVYAGDWILVEFGGRNVTEPNGPHEIVPSIAERIPSLDFPVGKVIVLSPERTFWEKATMIHVECHRQRGSNPDRISRHWYDLVMLNRGEIGEKALADWELLEDVVRYKTVFFNASYAHYDACLTKGFRLVPENTLLGALRRDYESMQSAGMFDVPPPAFEELLEELQALENRING